MLLALSKFLPRVLHRRSDRSGNDAPEHLKQATCRVVLLDDSELSLDVKVNDEWSLLLTDISVQATTKEFFK